jgi:hypothetical protein
MRKGRKGRGQVCTTMGINDVYAIFYLTNKKTKINLTTTSHLKTI